MARDAIDEHTGRIHGRVDPEPHAGADASKRHKRSSGSSSVFVKETKPRPFRSTYEWSNFDGVLVMKDKELLLDLQGCPISACGPRLRPPLQIIKSPESGKMATAADEPNAHKLQRRKQDRSKA